MPPVIAEGALFRAVAAFSPPFPKKNVLMELPKKIPAKGFVETEESLPVARP
jgi:hypothetical protein